MSLANWLWNMYILHHSYNILIVYLCDKQPQNSN